ncbi:MAG: hypothetical protein LBC99_03815 [Spirochaetota bacterium]|nr:hypothetical protein [Spirochaetota bacterium]
MSPVMNQVGGSKDKISFWVKGTAAGSNIFFNTDSSNTGSFGATGTTAAYSIIKLNNGPYTWISSFDPEATNTGSFPNWTKITLDCAGKNFLTDLQKADGRTVCFKIRIGPGRDINLYIDNVIYEGSVPPVSSSAAASSAAASSAAVSSASLSRSSLEPSTDSVDSPEFAFNGADFEAAAAATSSSGVTVSRVIYAEESAFFGNRCLLVQGTASAGVTPYISPAMYRPSAGRNMISFWVKGTATAAYIFFAGTASNDNSPTFGSGSGTVTYATIPLDGTHTWRQNFTAMETGTYTDWTKVTFDCTGKNFFTSLQGSGTFCYKIRVSDGGTINLYIDNVIYETSPEGGSSAGASSAAASSSSAIPLQNAAVPLFTNAGFTLPGGSNYDNDVPKDETTGNNYGSSKAVYADSEDSILGSCMRLTYTSSGTARLVYQSPVGAFNTHSGYSRITFYIKGTLTGDFRIFLTSNNNIGSNNKVFDIINDSATTLSAAEPSGYTYGSATFGTWTKITLNYTASNHSLTTGATKALQIRVGGSSVNCDLFVDEFGWEN